MIAVESRPPGNEHELLPVCSPRSPTELAVVLSRLESEGFYDLVSNDYFGSLHVGPIIPLFNEKIVLVPEMNMGQLSILLRGKYDAVVARNSIIPFGKVQGRPFKVSEIRAKIEEFTGK